MTKKFCKNISANIKAQNKNDTSAMRKIRLVCLK